MAIKIIVNYPQTEEGILILEERLADVFARSLRRKLSRTQMDELVSKLTQNENTIN